MWTVKNRIWWQLHHEGIISEDEATEASFGSYYRTVEEFSAPFNDADSAVCQAGLRLVDIQTRETICPYQQGWEQLQKQLTPVRARAYLSPLQQPMPD
jgi:hypothetical protein